MKTFNAHRTGHLAPRAALACLLLGATGAAAGAEVPIPNPDPSLGDLFGISVAAVGTDKVIIGAPGYDVEGTNEGAAYLYDLNGNPLHTFYGPNLVPQEFFGILVNAIGNDKVLISAAQYQDKQGPPTLPGKAYLFDLDGNLLQTFTNPKPSAGDVFGVAAVLGTDLIVIGSPGDDTDGVNAGIAFLFQVGNPEPIGVFHDPTPQPGDASGFGFGFPIAALGTDRFVVGARNADGGIGELHVFDMKIQSGPISTIAHPDPNYELVNSVATLGDRVLVGSESAPVNGIDGAGRVFIFDALTGALETTVPNPAPHQDDGFGASVVALGSARFAVGADQAGLSDAGTVYLFHASGNLVGTFLNPVPLAGDAFGLGLAAIGCNGLVVGAPQGDDIFDPAGPGKASVFTDLAGGCLPDYVQVVILRLDEFDNQKVAFELSVDVVIPDVDGVTGVTVTTGGARALPLSPSGGTWSITIPYFSLGSMQESLHGLWTVDIQGDSPSVSTFTFNAAALQDVSFFAEPTNVFPPGSSMGVPPQVVFTWEDPTFGLADGIFVNSESNGGKLQQDDNSVLGTLDFKDSSWGPPLDLAEGFNEFEVAYIDFDDDVLVSALQVVSGGPIAWGESPFAPLGYPPATPLLALGSATRVSFDVAASIGFNPPQEFPAAGQPSVHTVGDVDRDGFLDVVVAIPDPDPGTPGVAQVFRNLGIFKGWEGLEPQPPFAVGHEPGGIALGFFNNDFHPDLAVTNAGDNNVSIFINNSDGTFQPLPRVPVGNRPSAVTTGDYNEDFLTDLAVSNEDDNTVTILLGDGQGGFSSGAALPVFTVGVGPVMISSGDFDGNKCPDLSGPNQGAAGAKAGSTGTVFVALGIAHAGFIVTLYPVGNQPNDVANADFNRDGLDDIAAVNTGDGTVSLLINVGKGSFVPGPVLPVGAQPLSVEAVDLDGDSRPDLAIVAIDPRIGPAVQVLRNTSTQPGEVRFDAPIAFGVDATPLFVVSGDFDGDGAPDLVTVNSDPGGSGGSVTVLVSEPVPPPPCLADLDGDGMVRSNDLMALIHAWGPCPKGAPCRADLNGDGQVAIVDFLTLLAGWGPCP